MPKKSKDVQNGIRVPARGTMSYDIWMCIQRHGRVYGRCARRDEVESEFPSYSRATIATVLRNYRIFHDLPDARTGKTVKEKQLLKIIKDSRS